MYVFFSERSKRMYASLDEICANDAKPFFGTRAPVPPFQPTPESFYSRPRNGPINISSPYGGIIPKQYMSYAPALPASPPPAHQYIHPSLAQSAPPAPVPSPSSSPENAKASAFFAKHQDCQSAIEHIRVCKECRNKLELIQEKEDSTQTIDNILEIATFISAGLFFVYVMDSVMNLRRR